MSKISMKLPVEVSMQMSDPAVVDWSSCPDSIVTAV